MKVFWILLAIAVVVTLIYLEGRRQSKIYGPPSGRRDALGAGLLELQKHLEPDRKMEILAEEQVQDEAPDAGEPGDDQPVSETSPVGPPDDGTDRRG